METMLKKALFILVLIFSLTPSYFVFADLQMSEIMYDLKNGSDTGREWIEIYNDDEKSVDVSTFKIFEADTDHKIKLVQGDSHLEPKNYAVIVSDLGKFKADWPNFTGTIFDSSFSLSNDGEVLTLKDKNLNVVDQYVYKSSSGGAGDGKSLQKINGTWISAMPTPGTENKIPTVPVPSPSIVKNKIIPKKNSPELKIPVQNLAQVLPFKVVENEIPKENHSPYIFVIIFIVFVVTGTSAVYFVRKRKISTQNGDDFEILDE